MRLNILGQIYFRDIRRTVPVGIPEGVSRDFLFFAKETCNAARRDVVFASIYDNPDYAEHSLLTPVDAVCYPSYSLPCVLIFVRPEKCTETMALHELMHACLYFGEGYHNPRRLRRRLPFYVQLLGREVGNIAMDLHTNNRLRKRGFPIDSLREEYFGALEEYLPLMGRPHYADEAAIQWQIAAIWAHMLAGSPVYGPTDRNLRAHREFDRVCRRHSPRTIRFRDLMVDAYQRIGYDSTEKVGRVVEQLTPELFKALGERFRAEYLQRQQRENAIPGGPNGYEGDVSICRGEQP